MGEGRNLKKLLSELGIQTKTLAEKADVPPTTLYSVVNRDSGVDTKLVQALADLSGRDFLEILKYIKMGDYDPANDPIANRIAAEADGSEDEQHIDTIAAHHDAEDWTPEELAEIEEFKKYVRSKRQSK